MGSNYSATGININQIIIAYIYITIGSGTLVFFSSSSQQWDFVEIVVEDEMFSSHISHIHIQ